MKKIRFFSLLIILLLNTPIVSFGQKKLKYADYGWTQVGLSTSPDIVFRILRADNDQLMGQDYLNRKDREIPKIGFGLGATIIYQTKRFGFFEIGLHYQNLGYKTKGYPYENYPGWNAITYQNEYFASIPLIWFVRLGENKLHFETGLGLYPSLQLFSKRVDFLDSLNQTQTIVREKGASFEPNLFVSIRAGASYQVTDKITLRISPEYKIGLFRNDGFSHLWGLGLNVGVYYFLH